MEIGEFIGEALDKKIKDGLNSPQGVSGNDLNTLLHDLGHNRPTFSTFESEIDMTMPPSEPIDDRRSRVVMSLASFTKQLIDVIDLYIKNHSLRESSEGWSRHLDNQVEALRQFSEDARKKGERIRFTLSSGLQGTKQIYGIEMVDN